jgi:ELWxxDGT repeat protein
LAAVGSTLFFAADNGTVGSELWRSDGTGLGTRLVADIKPGADNSFPFNLTNVNGRLFFFATTSLSGTELWTSNGAASGTSLVTDIDPGIQGSNPFFLTNVNGQLFFAASDGAHGEEPWIVTTSLATVATTTTSRPAPFTYSLAVRSSDLRPPPDQAAATGSRPTGADPRFTQSLGVAVFALSGSAIDGTAPLREDRTASETDWLATLDWFDGRFASNFLHLAEADGFALNGTR